MGTPVVPPSTKKPVVVLRSSSPVVGHLLAEQLILFRHQRRPVFNESIAK